MLVAAAFAGRLNTAINSLGLIMLSPTTTVWCQYFLEQGQKLLKKESDVGMLLTGKQSTETSCMLVWCSLVYKAQKQAACRDAAYLFTEHKQAACRMSS